MQYKINTSDKYSLAEINLGQTNLITAFISADIQTETTLHNQATEEMFAAALLSGAGTLTREQFIDKVKKLGAEISVHITDGRILIKLQSRKEHFSKLLNLTKIMIERPSFTQTELKRIFVNTKNALIESKEDSRSIAEMELRNSFYSKKDRKFSFSIDELLKEISVVNTTHFKELHNVFLQTPWTCSIAGDRESITVFSNLVSKLKDSTSSRLLEYIHEAKPIKRALKLTNVPSKQNIDFSIGVPVPITIHHPDFMPLTLAVAILGNWGGFAGRLMSTVREQEGLTYGIYAKLDGFTDREEGYVRIMTFFAPLKANEGLESTFREITTLYGKGVTESELAQFKNILQTKNALKHDSTTSLLAELHAFHCLGFTLDEMQKFKDEINNVTLSEVNEVIKKYLNPMNFSICGAGPTKPVQKELKSFFASMQ